MFHSHLTWCHSGGVAPSISHEIVGRVTRVGANVTDFKAGDMAAAVGCMVESCRTCGSCARGSSSTATPAARSSPTTRRPDGTAPVTYGGYSDAIVVNSHFVLRVSPKLDPPRRRAAAVRRHHTLFAAQALGRGPRQESGHRRPRRARAHGREVRARVRRAHGAVHDLAVEDLADGKRLGADEVVISKNADEMAKHARSFDLIVNTVAASHDLDPFISLLKRDGTLVLVGAPEHPHPSPTVFNLLFGRRSLAGSGIGGIAETQEMLDFCAEKNIVSDIELIPVQRSTRPTSACSRAT